MQTHLKIRISNKVCRISKASQFGFVRRLAVYMCINYKKEDKFFLFVLSMCIKIPCTQQNKSSSDFEINLAYRHRSFGIQSYIYFITHAIACWVSKHRNNLLVMIRKLRRRLGEWRGTCEPKSLIEWKNKAAHAGPYIYILFKFVR